jgi:hypothetical protein
MHAKFAYTACMKQITVRRVRETCLEEARRLSRQRGVAMNTVLVEVLEQGLGTGKAQQTNGLERFSGDSNFGPGWDRYLEELRQVNPADWK